MAAHTTMASARSPTFSSSQVAFLGLVFLFGCGAGFAQDTTLSPICGSTMYDVQTLTSVPYWTISRPGICYADSHSNCFLNLAFCKSLPLDITGQVPDIGASQTSDLVGNTPLVLGHTNSFTDDMSGDQLIVGYSNGAPVKCGNLSVIMFLKCNPNVYWQVPTDGSPAEIPNNPLLVLPTDRDCYYIITADFAGACANLSTGGGLSPGTVLIIIFFVVLTVYMVSGLIYNKMAGAQGYELIPNYQMWKRLPSDIMMGCGFLFSCITCQQMQQQSTDSYDAI